MSSRSPASPRRKSAGSALRRCRPALGTLVDIQLSGPSPAILARALEAAFSEIARCERALSAHLADNDLARLRSARPGATVVVDPRTRAVLRRAAALARASQGAFDPRRGLSVDAPAFDSACRFTSTGRLRLAAPLDIDLGGIAKGYALDRALAVLRRAGVATICINAGGDLRVHGAVTRLRLRHPAGGGRFFELGDLRAGAAATSAQTFRVHLRNPRDGRPAPREVSITVFARTALSADALTKVVAFAPAELAVKILARHRAHAALVARDGSLRWLDGPPPAVMFTAAA